MDFSEQLSNYKSEQDIQDDEGVSLLREEENNEQIEQEEVQKGKFNAAYEGTDLSAVGPSADDYDYATEYNDGNTFPTDEENGINLSNKNIKPATRQIAGHDMATGERYTSEYESPLISEAIAELQESNVNTKSGAPPKDMMPLSKIARGMGDQDATYEQFVENTQGPWSDQQRATAWEGMTKAKQTTNDVKELGKRHFQEAETVQYTRAEGIQDSIPETDLVSSPVWIQSGKAVIDYFNPNGSDGMDAQEIHDFNLNLMSNFNFNIPMMMFYANEITNSNDPELAKSFLFLMDQNEATDISMDSVDRAIGGIMGDISTYLTAGGSVLVSRIAGASMKAGIKQALTKVLAVTAVDSVAGGAMGATADVSGQEVEIAAGEREEIDVGQAAKSGAISAALTATIGVGAAAIADPALRKFGVGQVQGAINKINPAPKAPIINKPIGPEQPLAAEVEFKSALRTEVGTLFENTKKPKMKVSRLVNEVKAMVKNGTVKIEEVNWSGLKDLESKSTVDRAEIDAILKNNIPVPSLDRTVRNKFSDMSFSGDNYREYVINADKVGEYGGPTGHFSGEELAKGGKVGEQANVGHLRMEDVEHNGEVGTMFLEGQSDIRKVPRQRTFTETKIAEDVRDSVNTKVFDEAKKTYRKARDSYNGYMLETAKKYNMNPQDVGFNIDLMANMKPDEVAELVKLMQVETKAQGKMDSAREAMHDILRTELNGEPFTPFRQKKSSNSMLFRSAVMEAMNSESPFLAWPKTKQQIGRIEGWDGYGADFVNSDGAKSASEFMTKDMKKLAESSGFEVEEFNPKIQNPASRLDKDEFYDKWLMDQDSLAQTMTYSDDELIKRVDDVYREFSPKSSGETFYRIKFTKEQRREWGEKGAAMFSWGGAAIVGSAAFDQKRNDRGQFE